MRTTQGFSYGASAIDAISLASSASPRPSRPAPVRQGEEAFAIAATTLFQHLTRDGVDLTFSTSWAPPFRQDRRLARLSALPITCCRSCSDHRRSHRQPRIRTLWLAKIRRRVPGKVILVRVEIEFLQFPGLRRETIFEDRPRTCSAPARIRRNTACADDRRR